LTVSLGCHSRWATRRATRIVLNLDVEEQRRVLSALEANDFTVDGLAFIERAHPARFDAVPSLPKHLVGLAIV
jgi:hypothetical protein